MYDGLLLILSMLWLICVIPFTLGFWETQKKARTRREFKFYVAAWIFLCLSGVIGAIGVLIFNAITYYRNRIEELRRREEEE